MPDGTVISRLKHLVDGVQVWDSGATVVQPVIPPGAGSDLCAPAPKLDGVSAPKSLRRIKRSNTMPISPSESVRICHSHWQINSMDELYDNSTERYFYQFENGSQTVADQVQIRGLHYFPNEPFRVFCVIDAERRQVIKSWDGMMTFFGFGGNTNTDRYLYGGDDPLRPQLPVEKKDDSKCLLTNPTGTVVVHDMKSDSSRILPGRTPVATYDCVSGPQDAINGAYGPMADCLFNTNKTVQFLLDPEWGFSQEMKKYSPNGRFLVGAHYNRRYDNAFWDGTAFYVGDGGNTFLPLCTCIDVVAHEIGHSITQMTSDLIYSGESGCINEAFSDMMAEAVEFYFHRKADFKIGVNCMKTRPYLRDLSVRKSYLDYVPGTDPHHCSAIFNRAFYNLANSPGWGIKHAWKVFSIANAVFWRKVSVTVF